MIAMQEESSATANVELMAPSLTVNYDNLNLVWPSHDEPSVIRKHAVLILTEDPDQRLQLQHLAALLHLRLGGPVPPDALLAALSGPGSAGIFACQQVAMQFQGYSRVPVVRLQVERLVQLLQQAASSGSDSSSALDQGQRPAARQPRSSSGQVPEVTLQHCIQWVYHTWPPNTGDPDALLASTLALLLLFSEGSSSWGTAPLQLPLEEVVAGLAAAIQRDDKLSALLRGPAGARPGGLEQQVLGLVSQAAFRPYFVLQSTQGGTIGTLSLQLHKLGDSRLGDGTTAANGTPLLPSWVTPSDLAVGVANLHRLQVAGPGGAVAPTALLRPPGPPARRPSSGAAGGEAGAGSRPLRDNKGWAIGPLGGSKGPASGGGTPRMADPVVASLGLGLTAGSGGAAWGTAVGSPAGAAGLVGPPHAASSNGATKMAAPAWQQVVGFSSNSSSGHAALGANTQDQQPPAATTLAPAAAAAAEAQADEAANSNWHILGSSPLTAACSEALYGLGALQAAATTAGHLEASSPALPAAAAAAGGSSATASDMVHRRSTWSGGQAGAAAAGEGLAATSVGSVPSKTAAGATGASGPNKDSSSISSGTAPATGQGTKAQVTEERSHSQLEGGSGAGTPVAGATYGTSPGAASLTHLFMSGPGSFPAKGAGILSWSQQHSPRGVEVPQAIASCWSSRPSSATAPAAAAANGGATGGNAAGTAWPANEASNTSLQPQNSSTQVGANGVSNDAQLTDAGALQLAQQQQQQQLRAPAGEAWFATAAAGGGEGSALQRGPGAYPFAAAARGGSAWSEAGREDTSIVSDTEQSSEGPELFFGALGSSHPGQGPAPIASLWSRGEGPGSSRLQGTTSSAAAAAAEAYGLRGTAAAKAGGNAMQAGSGWGDADLPFDLPDDDLLLEGVSDGLKGGAPEDAAHHQHQQQLLQSMIGGLEGSFATLSLGPYQAHHQQQQDLGASGGPRGGGAAAAMDVQQQLQQVIGQLMGHAAASNLPHGTEGGLYGMDVAHAMQHRSANVEGMGTHHAMGAAAGTIDAAARSADTEKGQRKQGMGLLLGSLPPPPPPPRRPNPQQLQTATAGVRGPGRASGMDSMGSTPRSGTPREGLLGQSPLASGGVRATFGPQGTPGGVDPGVPDAGSGCVRNWASVAAKEPAAITTPLLTPRTGAALRELPALGLGAAAGASSAAPGLGLPGRSKPGSAAPTPRSSHTGGLPMGPGAMLGAGGRGGHLAAGEEGPEGGVPLARLPGSVRAEVEALVARSGGLLKVEDFDEGVVHQLAARRSEAEAVAAVRSIAQYELGSIQHMAAYLNHIIKHYMPPGAGDGQQSTGRMGGPGGSAVRVPSMPVNNKAMLQKLPLKVYRRLEEVVAGCPYLEWHHFDAGVIKVLGQLSKMAEDDVFTELDLLAHADLSNVEYMPAYLNKRLNNKLWSRRKLEG